MGDVTVKQWGEMPDGTPVRLFTLAGDNGMEVDVATYGGIITRLTAPDKDGVLANVTLGYDSLSEYLTDCCYFGCVVGRVANRIANGRFALDGKEYRLDRNHGEHHLHGGSGGLHTRVWDGDGCEGPLGPQLTLSCVSPDGDQGYPGNLSVSVTYTLTDTRLRIDFKATADAATAVNLTNHSYFNLTGRPGTDCLEHELTLNAGRYLAVDDALIPTGEVAPVDGTPLDFTDGRAVGERVDDPFGPLKAAGGYDHCYVLDGGDGLVHAATVCDPESGRVLEVSTTQPCIQVYSGNHILEALPGRDGVSYGPRSGICIEAQGYTDAPNRPEFPAVFLRENEEYNQTIVYKFCTK